jgi:hypothetical protein
MIQVGAEDELCTVMIQVGAEDELAQLWFRWVLRMNCAQLCSDGC